MIFEQFHHLHEEQTTPVLGAPLAIAETQPSVAEDTSSVLFANAPADDQDAFGFQTNPLFIEITSE